MTEVQSPAPPPLSLLKLIAFLGGACLMALEMAGMNLLAPHFGSTIYTWGSIIGIFLGALSAGYWAGGLIADKYPRLSILGVIVVVAAILIFFIPLVGTDLCRWLNGELQDMSGPVITDKKWRALIGALVLYTVPSILIGMVSPFVVRLAARDVEGMGKTAGGLYAVSTLGSIVGTFLVSFILVEAFGTKSIIFGVAVVMVLTAVLCFVGQGKNKLVSAAVFVSVLVALPSYRLGVSRSEINHTLFTNQRTVFEKESVYHHIAVVEGYFPTDFQRSVAPYARMMLFNNQTESAIQLDSPNYIPGTPGPKDPPGTLALKNERVESAAGYARMLHLGLPFLPTLPKDMLVIGCGGGVIPMEMIQDYGPAIERIDVVDIDPLVFEMAHRYFGLPRNGESDVIHNHIEDGRRFVARDHGPWDYLILDAYTSGGRIPKHLVTKEYFELLNSKRKPGGVVIANVISKLTRNHDGPDHSRLYRSVVKTMREVYGEQSVYVFPRNRGTKRAENIIIVAAPDCPGLSMIEVRNQRFAEFASTMKRPAMDIFLDKMIPPAAIDEEVVGDAVLLTDDFCPTDSMIPY